LTASFNVGVVPNWDFERYVTFLRRAEREPEAKQRLLGIADGRKIFFSRSIDRPSIRSYLETELEGTYRVVQYDGDRLVVDVESPESGFVSFIDNWDANWRASVDGQPTRIELLFGTFKSVPIDAGSTGSFLLTDSGSCASPQTTKRQPHPTGFGDQRESAASRARAQPRGLRILGNG
jgi:hypothetical protein